MNNKQRQPVAFHIVMHFVRPAGGIETTQLN